MNTFENAYNTAATCVKKRDIVIDIDIKVLHKDFLY